MKHKLTKITKISSNLYHRFITGLEKDIGGYKMEFEYINTISEIEYSDEYETHSELFEKGITILKNRILNGNYEDFTETEQETLEEIFTIINRE